MQKKTQQNSIKTKYLLSYIKAATIGLVQPKKFLQPITMRHEVTAYSISEGKLGMDISPSHMHFAKLIRILMNLVTLTIGNPRIFIEFGNISKKSDWNSYTELQMT